MTELFKNISDKVRDTAKTAWEIACAQKNPITAADFLNSVTELYRNYYTEEEIEFLQFYFQTQMEMMKNE